MKDIQFILLTDTLRVAGVEDLGSVRGIRKVRFYVAPLATFVSSVSINDSPIATFFISGQDSIIVDLPSNLDSVPVESLKVSLASSTLTNASKATLSFGPSSSKIVAVEGVQKLIQQVIKMLLTTVGSNRFSPSEGGSLLRGLNGATGPSAQGFVATTLVDALKKTEGYIIERQVGSSVPAGERLISLTLKELSFNETNEATAMLSFSTFAGTSFTLPVEI